MKGRLVFIKPQGTIMFTFCLNPKLIYEKIDLDIVIYNLEDESVYIFNESGAIAFDILLDSNSLQNAEKLYFQKTEFPVSSETQRDYREFRDYLFSENIFIKKEV